MAGFSYPFDTGPGSTITEDQWSYLTRDAVGTGVHEPADGTPGPVSDELTVLSLAEAGIVYVWPGRATINGFHYQQGGSEVITVTANSNTTQDRIDAVVLRLDLTTNAITLETKLGVPADTPVAPAVAANELLLATFKVRKNSNTVLSNEVTDKRTFVGRRMKVTDSTSGNRGDIVYSPFTERWSGLDGFGFGEEFAYLSELNAHQSATDPHPQYLTAAEGDSAYKATTSIATLSLDSLFTGGYYWRSINLPGGFKIVRFYMMLSYNGTDQNPNVRIATLNDNSFRPGFSQYFMAHQYKFSNDTGNYPMVVVVNSDGNIHTYQNIIQGGSFLSVSGTYFVGSGL